MPFKKDFTQKLPSSDTTTHLSGQSCSCTPYCRTKTASNKDRGGDHGEEVLCRTRTLSFIGLHFRGGGLSCC